MYVRRRRWRSELVSMKWSLNNWLGDKVFQVRFRDWWLQIELNEVPVTQICDKIVSTINFMHVCTNQLICFYQCTSWNRFSGTRNAHHLQFLQTRTTYATVIFRKLAVITSITVLSGSVSFTGALALHVQAGNGVRLLLNVTYPPTPAKNALKW